MVTNSQWSAHFLLLDIHKYVGLESLINDYVVTLFFTIYTYTHITTRDDGRGGITTRGGAGATKSL